MQSNEGATAIMNAVQSDNLENLELLVKYGANVNHQDKRGFTSLHRAAEMGKNNLVLRLLEIGADKEISAEGHTALSLATAMKHEEIIKILT